MKKAFFLLLTVLAFGCQQQTQSDTSNTESVTKAGMPDKAIFDLFEEINPVKIHLFATQEANPNEENYPFIGKPIAGDATKFLPDGIDGSPGNVFACYRTETSGHYILRVKGEKSSELVLAIWNAENGKLEKVADLAFLRCDESMCKQQDAWIYDLDDNRTFELIVRSHQKDMEGNISNEQFTVSTDDGMGKFKAAGEKLSSLAVKDYYVMK